MGCLECQEGIHLLGHGNIGSTNGTKKMLSLLNSIKYRTGPALESITLYIPASLGISRISAFHLDLVSRVPPTSLMHEGSWIAVCVKTVSTITTMTE